MSDITLGVFPGLNVSLDFTLNEPRFFLMCEPDAVKYAPTYEIQDMQLLVLNRTLPSDNYLSLTRPVVSQDKTTIQNFSGYKMTSHPIPAQSQSFSIENFQGSSNIGTRIAVTFVKNDAYMGSYSESPYCMAQEFGPSTNSSLVNNVTITLESEDLDGFFIFNGSLRINTYVHYQRFLTFFGTAASQSYTSGIGFNDFASTGG